MADLLSRAGVIADLALDRAERAGILSALLTVAAIATALFWVAGDAAPWWLLILASVWPGRTVARAAGQVAEWRQAREAAPPAERRSLEAITLAPLPDPPPSPPSFAPRRP
ncbi:hypothetical protein [Corynebacterium silvaticum]|uniref:Uncharacterized protein n=1 Tax=Corynebacterium silvaticum TaxID=2320431 RepID=A0A7Y4LJ55_9CORY|nr:hypothetical protein [Corynebacterium silvaticum]ARU45886.1 hypothetical protein CBE74_04555 [Corynebacterium silvaticum]MBH5300439.1 hypothetical protein [Corynebacterium silvaticum]NOM64636.1 hypothetical protein [Corynebacterium silvaticum]NON69878.1 hypothetical protein [Corynebacterium silvaticum]TFA93282.1 hypothetical protein EU802_03750 [Corynebacterium silvaticum]